MVFISNTLYHTWDVMLLCGYSVLLWVFRVLKLMICFCCWICTLVVRVRVRLSKSVRKRNLIVSFEYKFEYLDTCTNIIGSNVVMVSKFCATFTDSSNYYMYILIVNVFMLKIQERRYISVEEIKNNNKIISNTLYCVYDDHSTPGHFRT